jgi:NitT/TauT family transport system ATP-binding protein
MVFQDFNQLFPWKTVLGNITYPLKVCGVTDKNERNRIGEEYLEKVNLLRYKDYYPHQLSGGMKQRVAIAKGLALGSKIILMDEPFAALDAMSRNQMQDELLSIKEKVKMTVIFITHNIQEAVCLGNRILVMSKNGVIKENIDNPLTRPISPATPGFGPLWDHLHSLITEESEKNISKVSAK